MILKGQKTILRPIKMTDAPFFVKWLRDPEVTQFINARRITVKKEKEWIANIPKKKQEKNFSIETHDKVLIGNAVLRISKKSEDNFAEFGIMIGDKRYWNQGYGTDVVKTIVKYGFEILKLHRIQLSVAAFNPRALRVYRKIGFKPEGRKREHIFHKGKFKDSLQMGILDREWKKKMK